MKCVCDSTAKQQDSSCGDERLHVSTASCAAAFFHQQTADESQWKAEDSQTYATASEILSNISSLHKTPDWLIWRHN